MWFASKHHNLFCEIGCLSLSKIHPLQAEILLQKFFGTLQSAIEWPFLLNPFTRNWLILLSSSTTNICITFYKGIKISIYKRVFKSRLDKTNVLLAPIATASFFANRHFLFKDSFSGKKDRVKSGTGFGKMRSRLLSGRVAP